VIHQFLVLSLLSYDRLAKKPLLFKSFTAGLTVQEFDEIYNKEITIKYVKHQIQHLSKENIEKETLVL
jgi:hypothetical protein